MKEFIIDLYKEYGFSVVWFLIVPYLFFLISFLIR